MLTHKNWPASMSKSTLTSMSTALIFGNDYWLFMSLSPCLYPLSCMAYTNTYDGLFSNRTKIHVSVLFMVLDSYVFILRERPTSEYHANMSRPYFVLTVVTLSLRSSGTRATRPYFSNIFSRWIKLFKQDFNHQISWNVYRNIATCYSNWVIALTMA